MKKAAVIFDSRKNIQDVIDRHMDFLPGWECEHISDIKFETGSEYQYYLLSVNFWKRLKYDKVLFFQCDSEILREGIDEFMCYSYVGAPWKSSFPGNTSDRRGGNGGISIRDVSAHIEVLENKKRPPKTNEDVWFSHNLSDVAPHEVCKRFSVESDFQLGSMCAHAIDKHLTIDQCLQVRTQYD